MSLWVKWFAGDFLNGIADLEPNQIAVYSVVLNLIYDGEGPTPDNAERIARRCNMRPTTCKKAIDALVEMGKLIRRDGVLSNARCEKEIKSRQNLAQKSAESAHSRWNKRGEKDNENNDGAMRPHMPDECDPHAYQKPEARIEKEEPPNPLQSQFAEFYSAYPRKVDPKKAEKAYRTARKTVSHEQIMAGLAGYVAETRGEPIKFVKHPASWLNAGSWENQSPSRPVDPQYSDEMWEHYLIGWGQGKPWPVSLRGPPPNMAGCLVPERLLARYRVKFGDLEPNHIREHAA